MGTNKRKGISLIVLVITIIVMIILATAIILSLTNSGIIGKANKAKTDSDMASIKEIVATAYSDWILMSEEAQANNNGNFEEYARYILETKGINPNQYSISETGEVSKLITFYIYTDGAVDKKDEFKAIEGSSWEEWINSEYCTDDEICLSYCSEPAYDDIGSYYCREEDEVPFLRYGYSLAIGLEGGGDRMYVSEIDSDYHNWSYGPTEDLELYVEYK